jgi:transposase
MKGIIIHVQRFRKEYMPYTSKQQLNMSNEMTGALVGLSRDSVGDWLMRYGQGGFDALCQFNYGTNKSRLENHADSILKSLIERPPMNTNEARVRIEELTGISRSPSRVRAFMKRNGLRYIKTLYLRHVVRNPLVYKSIFGA